MNFFPWHEGHYISMLQKAILDKTKTCKTNFCRLLLNYNVLSYSPSL